MGAILKELLIRTSSKQRPKRIKAFFDSGSPRTFIRKDIAKNLGNILTIPEKLKFSGLGDGKFIVKEASLLWVSLKGIWCQHFCYIAERKDLEEELLIGYDFMGIYNLKLDLKKRRLIIDKEQLKRAQKVYETVLRKWGGNKSWRS